jgi:hypothetical protein
MRPNDVNVPLFLHVLGAMLLVGTLLVVAVALLVRRRDEGDTVALTRFGLRTLLIGVVPSYILMRVGAQWTESAEDLPDIVEESAWIGIGYITADAGILLLVISIVLAVIGLRRLSRPEGGGTRAARAVGVISTLLLVAYLVAVWAMSAKPD